MKFQTDTRPTSVQDSLDMGKAANVEVEMSVKTLKKSTGLLLTELTGDKQPVKLDDYIYDNQSEGTFQGFIDETEAGDVTFKYIESVDLPEGLVKENPLKWNLETENFIPEVLEDSLPGITKPTYYIGSKYSAFPFHREDGDLRSVSYMIAGKEKVCYRFTFYISINLYFILRSGWGQI